MKEDSKYNCMWHISCPGPSYWQWRCLRCGQEVHNHPGLIRLLIHKWKDRRIMNDDFANYKTKSETLCRYCHKRIVKVNFTLREKWMHQPAEAAFQDGMHEFCKITVAKPVLPENDKLVTEGKDETT